MLSEDDGTTTVFQTYQSLATSQVQTLPDHTYSADIVVDIGVFLPVAADIEFGGVICVRI